jgi:TatD DNase family protein
MFIDSHCHLEMEAFDKDRKEVVERSITQGVTTLLTVGTEEGYFEKVREIVETYPTVYGAVGIHPHNAEDYTEAVAKNMALLFKHGKIVACGEIGLDFYRNYSPRDAQFGAFKDQIELAKDMGLPIIIHSRSAEQETLKVLTEVAANGAGGVVHCFSYGVDAARRVLDMGYFVSLPGTITYSNSQALIDVVKYLPADRILTETDAPFLTPHPYRGRRNEPAYVKSTAEKIAHVRGMPVEALAAIVHDNFTRLFLRGKKGAGP